MSLCSTICRICGSKSHVEHAIRLVQREVRDGAERDLRAVHQVDQPPGGGDEHVAPASPSRETAARRRAAVHDDGSHPRLVGELARLLVDLNREFARGRDDEREGVRLAPAPLVVPPCKPRERMPWMIGRQTPPSCPNLSCSTPSGPGQPSEMGMAYFWTGVGFLNLHLSMFLFTAEPKSMSWNVLMGSGMFSPEVSTGMSSYASKSIPVDSPNTGASHPRRRGTRRWNRARRTRRWRAYPPPPAWRRDPSSR